MTYNPYHHREWQTDAAFGAPTPPPAVPPGPPLVKRSYMVVAAVLVLAGGLWMLFNKNVIYKDSGIAECEALRDGESVISPDRQLTDQQYRRLRGAFADSRYDDIRNHGTRAADMLWQSGRVARLEHDGGVRDVPQPLARQLAGLNSACVDQGIIDPD
jgi:hypothetical protein